MTTNTTKLKPTLENVEKEILERSAKLDDINPIGEDDIYQYFKRYKVHLKTFAKYIEKGSKWTKTVFFSNCQSLI